MCVYVCKLYNSKFFFFQIFVHAFFSQILVSHVVKPTMVWLPLWDRKRNNMTNFSHIQFTCPLLWPEPTGNTRLEFLFRTSRFLRYFYGCLFALPRTAVHRYNDKKRLRKEQLHDGTFGKPQYGICPSRHVRSHILS